MWNAGKTPARMIEVIAPGGFEGFFHGVSDLIAGGSPAEEELARLAAEYGLEFATPDWLPDVIARYGLKTPPDAK